MVFGLVGCKDDTPTPEEFVDYAAEFKIDLTANRKRAEATLLRSIDGDTTHFNVSESDKETGVLKARYLGIDTPESTGVVQEWGKTASLFTESKLESATSIIIESSTTEWELDSTSSGRDLVWVWYRTSDTADYRLLNLELIQSGYALPKGTSSTIYATEMNKGLAQAQTLELRVFSNVHNDVNFYYGAAQPVTVKEIRNNLSTYLQTDVQFDAIISLKDNNTLYVQEYDAETDQYYGLQVYLGYGNSDIDFLEVGNEVKFVGTLTVYYGTYQVSGVSYNDMYPDAEDNLELISEGNIITPEIITPEDITDDSKLQTLVQMNDLTVKSVYTTTAEGSSSVGAMTLTCESEGKEVSIRTSVLKEKIDGKYVTVTADYFEDKIIDVTGVLEYYLVDEETTGEYQIHLFTVTDVIIH